MFLAASRGARIYNQSYFTFNSLNAFILKGEGAQGMDLTFATLMARAGDEPDAVYGYAAKSVQISPDKLTYRFTMRPEARFHDGSKLTAHDVAFSLTTLKEKGHPLIDPADARHGEGGSARRRHRGRHLRRRSARATCRSMSPACRSSRRPITRRARSTKRRSIRRSAPGPYKVGKFEVNRFIEFDRVKDWWGADLPVNRGSYNFDTVRYEFYRDRDVAFEGFTAQELSVPRGVHLAHLGDALRFPGHQGWPRQARGPAR